MSQPNLGFCKCTCGKKGSSYDIRAAWARTRLTSKCTPLKVRSVVGGCGCHVLTSIVCPPQLSNAPRWEGWDRGETRVCFQVVALRSLVILAAWVKLRMNTTLQTGASVFFKTPVFTTIVAFAVSVLPSALLWRNYFPFFTRLQDYYKMNLCKSKYAPIWEFPQWNVWNTVIKNNQWVLCYKI